MTLPTTSFRYVDFGKVFVANGALDFSALGASDAEVAAYGAPFFNRGLQFPEASPFAAQVGGVSAALLRFETGYLFALVQRRREGELSADPRTNRPFNQARFVVLGQEAIEQAFRAGAALYTSLAHASRDPEARGWLKDYTAVPEPQAWAPPLRRIEPIAPDREAVRFAVNAVVQAAGPGAAQPAPISVPLPGVDWLEKLQLAEAVQYWLLPRLGVITFALDYLTPQTVHLRLFPLPEDALVPLPPDRVFVPGSGVGFNEDHFASISSLGHEALYDAGLRDLVDQRMPTAAAVDLIKVEREGLPLPGDEVVRLYGELAHLGERRHAVLRRVPREDVLRLLRRTDLPGDLHLDLLQVAFENAHGLLGHYVHAHLALPRAARDDERVRAFLRAALGRSLEQSLDKVAPEQQAELFIDLLNARRPGLVPRGAPTPTEAVPPLKLGGGQPLLEALFLRRRTPALAEAAQAVAPHDRWLFVEALAVLDRTTDLRALLWLWRQAGLGSTEAFVALIERAVQPAWYAELGRNPAAWRELLEEGRALAQNPPPRGGQPAGTLLRALPPALVPFVWQSCLAVCERDAAFADWWLFNEAVHLPGQLPAVHEAIQRLSLTALETARPEIVFLAGRGGRNSGLSLRRACAPPGGATNEALFATVLRAWLEAGFRSLSGDLALAPEDIMFLVDHLPDSNEVLAAIAGSMVQAAAIRELPAEVALRWARAASGPRREPYCHNGRDRLFQRLIDLPAAGEPLVWHLLVEDPGSSGAAMPWSDYLLLLGRVRPPVQALGLPPEARLPAYLDLAPQLENKGLAEAFTRSQADLRQVFALLAARPAGPEGAARLMAGFLALAVFHVQETSAPLRQAAAGLLRACLNSPEAPPHLLAMPDDVLAYLHDQFCRDQPSLEAAGHFIEAELARRNSPLRPTDFARIALPAAPLPVDAEGEAAAAPPAEPLTTPAAAATSPTVSAAPLPGPAAGASLPAAQPVGPGNGAGAAPAGPVAPPTGPASAPLRRVFGRRAGTGVPAPPAAPPFAHPTTTGLPAVPLAAPVLPGQPAATAAPPPPARSAQAPPPAAAAPPTTLSTSAAAASAPAATAPAPTAAAAMPQPLLGQLALPGAESDAAGAPRTRDSAALLWVAIVALLIVACVVLVVVLVWLQSLPSAGSLLEALFNPSGP